MNYREKLFNAVGLIEDLEERPTTVALSGLEAKEFFTELRLPHTTALQLEINGNMLSITHSRIDISCVISNLGTKAWFDGTIDYSEFAKRAIDKGGSVQVTPIILPLGNPKDEQ